MPLGVFGGQGNWGRGMWALTPASPKTTVTMVVAAAQRAELRILPAYPGRIGVERLAPQVVTYVTTSACPWLALHHPVGIPSAELDLLVHQRITTIDRTGARSLPCLFACASTYLLGGRCDPDRDIGVHHFGSRAVGDGHRHHQLDAIGDLREIWRVQAGHRPQ